jgi:hypothetical protein
VEPCKLGLYERTGSTIEYHRTQIRGHLGFRERTVADAERLTEWLACSVCEAERRSKLVRNELLVRCRTERLEPPAAGQVERIVRSALYHRASADRRARGPAAGRGRRPAAGFGHGRGAGRRGRRGIGAGPDQVRAGQREPGVDAHRDGKLRAARAIGLFADVAPRVLAGWRARRRWSRRRIYAITPRL